jgi:hypothetical protein
MVNKIKKYINQRGAVQAPLIIGLLLLGVALPVALRLVQQSQETRRQAGIAGPCKQCVGNTCEEVASPPHCDHDFNECSTNSQCYTCTPGTYRCVQERYWQRCSEGSWVQHKVCDYKCGSTGPNCQPAPTNTLAPEPTNEPDPTDKPCKGVNQDCGSDGECCSGICDLSGGMPGRCCVPGVQTVDCQGDDQCVFADECSGELKTDQKCDLVLGADGGEYKYCCGDVACDEQGVSGSCAELNCCDGLIETQEAPGICSCVLESTPTPAEGDMGCYESVCRSSGDCKSGLSCSKHCGYDDGLFPGGCLFPEYTCWAESCEETLPTPIPTVADDCPGGYCLPSSECRIPGQGSCNSGICCDMPKSFVTATPLPTTGPEYTCETYCLPSIQCRIPGVGTCETGICCDMPKSFVTATPRTSIGPEPTNTLVPTTGPDDPTETPGGEPTSEPTGTGGGGDGGGGDEEDGCKPCPDGSFANAGTTSYDCNTDGAQLTDFVRWKEQYVKAYYQNQQIPDDELYGDYNCSGNIDVGDIILWKENYLETI